MNQIKTSAFLTLESIGREDRSPQFTQSRCIRQFQRRALAFGLNIVGTVRLLDLAEKRGFIASAEQLMQRMREQGYRIAPMLLQRIRGQDTVN